MNIDELIKYIECYNPELSVGDLLKTLTDLRNAIRKSDEELSTEHPDFVKLLKKNNRKEIMYHKAINKWGIEDQTNMIVEECAELIFTIMKYKRFSKKGLDLLREWKEKIKEEMADVEIMIGQGKILFGDISQVKSEKLFRLEKKLWEKKENAK
jgi:NTP pyrophosphatase (non-canonical NTP hydrolase)